MTDLLTLRRRAEALSMLAPLLFCAGCLIDVPPRAYRAVAPSEIVSPTPNFPHTDYAAVKRQAYVEAKAKGINDSAGLNKAGADATKTARKAAEKVRFAHAIPSGPACGFKNSGEFTRPCLSYIEYDDFGELWEPNIKNVTVHNQVGTAKSIVDASMMPAADGGVSQPIVLVFVHGWKHDAHQKPVEDNNIQGVKDLLNYLQSFYPESWVAGGSIAPRGSAGMQPDGQTCDDSPDKSGCVLLRHPVVGVYIGWRGRSYSEKWPVLQTLSYLQRQPTAYRVGNTSLTDTLLELSAAAHPPCLEGDPFEPYLLMTAHSFGALVLERGLAQAYIRELEQPGYTKSAFDALHPSSCTRGYGSAGTNLDDAKPRFADLVVYLNSAAPATEAKQVIDMLAEHEAKHIVDGQRFPVFLSVSSVTDSATKTWLPVGQTLSSKTLFGDHSLRGKDPQVCYDPEPKGNPSFIPAMGVPAFSQFSYVKHSAPHFEMLQSHEFVELSQSQAQCILDRRVDPATQDLCVAPVAPGSPKPDPVKNPVPKNVCHQLQGLPARRDRFGPVVSSDEACYLIQPKNLWHAASEGPRCNGTPYYVMEVPTSVIPDHNTIFTEQVLDLISLFVPQATPQTASTNDTKAARKGVIGVRNTGETPK